MLGGGIEDGAVYQSSLIVDQHLVGALRNFQRSLDKLIPYLKEYSDRDEPFNKWYRFPKRKEPIKLCVDEWNIWNSTPRGEANRYGVKTIYNWRDALWTAGMLNTFVHYAEDIGITNLAQMVNVLAPILTVGDQSLVQTTYHVMVLYRDGLLGKRMNCAFDSPKFEAEGAGTLDALDTAASLRNDGSVCLFVNNLTEDTSYTIALPDGMNAKEWVNLRADSFDDYNTLEREVVKKTVNEGGSTFVLEPGSVNRFII